MDVAVETTINEEEKEKKLTVNPLANCKLLFFYQVFNKNKRAKDIVKINLKLSKKGVDSVAEKNRSNEKYENDKIFKESTTKKIETIKVEKEKEKENECENIDDAPRFESLDYSREPQSEIHCILKCFIKLTAFNHFFETLFSSKFCLIFIYIVDKQLSSFLKEYEPEYYINTFNTDDLEIVNKIINTKNFRKYQVQYINFKVQQNMYFQPFEHFSNDLGCNNLVKAKFTKLQNHAKYNEFDISIENTEKSHRNDMLLAPIDISKNSLDNWNIEDSFLINPIINEDLKKNYFDNFIKTKYNYSYSSDYITNSSNPIDVDSLTKEINLLFRTTDPKNNTTENFNSRLYNSNYYPMSLLPILNHLHAQNPFIPKTYETHFKILSQLTPIKHGIGVMKSKKRLQYSRRRLIMFKDFKNKRNIFNQKYSINL
ncbi:hypothetical protein HZS_5116, partial [Henneguya salminicola]